MNIDLAHAPRPHVRFRAVLGAATMVAETLTMWRCVPEVPGGRPRFADRRQQERYVRGSVAPPSRNLGSLYCGDARSCDTGGRRALPPGRHPGDGFGTPVVGQACGPARVSRRPASVAAGSLARRWPRILAGDLGWDGGVPSRYRYSGGPLCGRSSASLRRLLRTEQSADQDSSRRIDDHHSVSTTLLTRGCYAPYAAVLPREFARALLL